MNFKVRTVNVWINTPTFRFPLVVNAFPQTEHLKGRSPVCVRMWICSAEPEEKFFLQTSQLWRLLLLLVEEDEEEEGGELWWGALLFRLSRLEELLGGGEGGAGGGGGESEKEGITEMS